jgi:hypothetical protein
MSESEVSTHGVRHINPYAANGTDELTRADSLGVWGQSKRRTWPS